MRDRIVPVLRGRALRIAAGIAAILLGAVLVAVATEAIEARRIDPALPAPGAEERGFTIVVAYALLVGGIVALFR